MIATTYKYKDGLLYNECVFFFGRGGYIQVDMADPNKTTTAHITVQRYKLADMMCQDFKTEPQELIISDPGFNGMYEHLKIPSTTYGQKKLRSFEEWKSGQNNLMKSIS